MASGNFATNATAGQPSPIMDTDDVPSPPQSATFNNYPGYWYTLDAEAGCPDVAAFAVTYGLTSADVDFNHGCDFDMDNDVDGQDLAEFPF